MPSKLDEPQVRVIRSGRRTFAIEVHEGGGVLVRAPTSATDEQIESLLRRKSVWLYAKRQAAAAVFPPDLHALTAGSSVLYSGRARRLRMVRDADVPLRFDGAQFWVREDAMPAVAEHLRLWLEERARELIPRMVAEAADRLGFEYREVRIADLKARWGSFSERAVLTFNWRLMMAPPFVLRYVVAHELAHTVEPHHGPRFWNLVRTICPRTDEARRWLHRMEADLHLRGETGCEDSPAPHSSDSLT